jgi:uncharacterized protein YjiK
MNYFIGYISNGKYIIISERNKKINQNTFMRNRINSTNSEKICAKEDFDDPN